MGLDRRLAGSRSGKSGCRLLIFGRDAPRFGWWVAARERTKVGDDLHFSYRSDKTARGRACRKGLLQRGMRVFGRPLFILHGTQAQRRENDSRTQGTTTPCRTWSRRCRLCNSRFPSGMHLVLGGGLRHASDDLHFSHRSDKTVLVGLVERDSCGEGYGCSGGLCSSSMVLKPSAEKMTRAPKETTPCRTWGRVPFRPPM